MSVIDIKMAVFPKKGDKFHPDINKDSLVISIEKDCLNIERGDHPRNSRTWIENRLAAIEKDVKHAFTLLWTPGKGHQTFFNGLKSTTFTIRFWVDLRFSHNGQTIWKVMSRGSGCTVGGATGTGTGLDQMVDIECADFKAKEN